MLKIALYVGLGLVLIVGVVLLLASRRPKTFRVERQLAMNAAPEAVYAQIADFHHWMAWSPWAKLDPAMKNTYSGNESGVGAAYAWAGKGKVGSGKMLIREAQPGALLEIQLDFIKPFEGHNVARFSFTPQGEGTLVIWAMDGPQPLLGRVMGLFFNLDAMIGKDFEVGLANLKSLVEPR